MKPFSPKIFGNAIAKKCSGDIEEIKLHICEFYLAGWNAGFIASWFDFSEIIVLEIILNENLPLQKKSSSIKHLNLFKAVKKICPVCSRRFKTSVAEKQTCSNSCLQSSCGHNAELIKNSFNYLKEEDVIMKIKSYAIPSNVETVVYERP